MVPSQPHLAMIPSTLVRSKPRGPMTFIARIAQALEGQPSNKSKPVPKCIAYEDDGNICGLPARYIDMQRGGFVCYQHRPAKRELVTP